MKAIISLIFLICLVSASTSAFAIVDDFTTDKSLYHDGDKLTISGTVSYDSEISFVTIQIFTPGKSNFADFNTIPANPNGSFSAIFNVGGPTWTSDGFYPIKVTYDGNLEKSIEYQEFSESTQPEPNALVSYNNNTNQVQVSWDFNTLPTDTKCLLKGDLRYNEDISNNNNDNYIPSFTPRFYSPITSAPVLMEAVNQTPNQFAEVVSCTGETRIDINTIMNHSENINNYQDFQLFLTFYVPDSNGDFSTQHSNRIDEVFVMYTPVNIWNNDDKEYGCGGQIGNVLYIDASGSDNSLIAHGDNGDNCDYLYLENNQYVEISSDSVATYGFHNDLFSLLISTEETETIETTPKKSNGDSDEWKTKPTFGISHTTNSPIVQCGFSWGDICHDITDNWHTSFEKIDLITGQPYNMTAKAYFENPPLFMEFSLVPQVGEYHNAEMTIEVFFENQDNDIIIESIAVNQKEYLIEESLLNGTLSKVSCGYVTSDCYELSINNIVFREIPFFEKMAIKAVDNQRRVQTTFTDGFEITGDSLNSPPTHMLFNKNSNQQKDNLYLELTRTDKFENLWEDKLGHNYTFNDVGTWRQHTNGS